eukprot:7160693-Pyramimonas_sp.AAC.1
MAWGIGRSPETLDAELDEFRLSFMGYCSDMGTELGVSEFKVTSSSDVLPKWFLPPRFDLDVDRVSDPGAAGDAGMFLDIAEDDECGGEGG